MDTAKKSSRLTLRRITLDFLVFCFALNALSAGAVTLPPGFHATLITTQLFRPTAMEFAPDGRLFICEQRGTVRVIKDMNLLPTPFATVPVWWQTIDERGLLGIAFDPGFATNHSVYLSYSYYADTNAHNTVSTNRVTRLTADGDVTVPGSEVTIFEQDGNSNDFIESYHVAGAIHFGPDGKLYIATGDGYRYRREVHALNRLYGKMLRVNADGSIPSDNPFYNVTTNRNRAIWALGLRNPFTFAFQPGTGRMFINDVGETYEEINEGFPGADYGWPCYDGSTTYQLGECLIYDYYDPSRLRLPIHSYRGGAVTGGAFYNPVAIQFPRSYVGVYFVGDYVNRWIHVLDPQNTNAVSEFATQVAPQNGRGVVDLKVSAEGRLYYLTRSPDGLWAIEYTNSPPALGVLRTGTNLKMLWPAPNTNYLLESTATLPNTNTWVTVTNTVLMTNGRYEVNVPSAEPAQFYRLRKLGP